MSAFENGKRNLKHNRTWFHLLQFGKLMKILLEIIPNINGGDSARTNFLKFINHAEFFCWLSQILTKKLYQAFVKLFMLKNLMTFINARFNSIPLNPLSHSAYLAPLRRRKYFDGYLSRIFMNKSSLLSSLPCCLPWMNNEWVRDLTLKTSSFELIWLLQRGQHRQAKDVISLE